MKTIKEYLRSLVGAISMVLLSLLVSACNVEFNINLTDTGSQDDNGQDSNDETIANEPPASVAELSFTIEEIKTLNFTWSDVEGASYYKLLENIDGASGYTQVGLDLPIGAEEYSYYVSLFERVNASYVLSACNEYGCNDSSAISVSDLIDDAIGYFKASDTEAYDNFGYSLKLSDDGYTLAVGAPQKNSTIDIYDWAYSSGAVYVFTKQENGWVQQAYLTASDAISNERFGHSLDLSSDGNRLVVGSPMHSAGSEDVERNNYGAAYVYSRVGDIWSMESFLMAENADDEDQFATAVSLSDDGNVLAVGSIGESSGSVGIDGYRYDNSSNNSGAVYMYVRDDSTGYWNEQAYIKASDTTSYGYFGGSLSISGDGTTLAVGAGNNYRSDAEQVYIFSYDGVEWSEESKLTPPISDSGDLFGVSLSLSKDGRVLAIGANGEDSHSVGINSDPTGNYLTSSGAAYIFNRETLNLGGNLYANWSFDSYIKASNTDEDDLFGSRVELSSDGTYLVVAAPNERSSGSGLDGNQSDNSAFAAGAVYVYKMQSGQWSQTNYIKSLSYDPFDDSFGSSVSISDDGSLAVGAAYEYSAAIGIGGDYTDNSASGSGAVYLY